MEIAKAIYLTSKSNIINIECSGKQAWYLRRSFFERKSGANNLKN